MSELRVGFNAYLLSCPELRGWNRYTVNLIAALAAQNVRPVLYSSAPLHPIHLARLATIRSLEIRVAPSMRYLMWENWWVPRQLKADSISVFHCPMNYGLPWTTACPRVLTLHDAIDQIYYGARSRLRDYWYPSALRVRAANWAARRRAHAIVTVSEHAKRDIVHFLRVPPNRVSVVYEAADPQFHTHIGSRQIEETKKKNCLHRPYFLYVGGCEGRKNIRFLIRGFATTKLDQVDLVIAGGKDNEREALMKLAGDLGHSHRVRWLGYVPDGDLPALYSGALAFIYPSEYEGFGLQICEAMAVGCPVLVARATSLPEILGEGGETFALDQPEELVNQMRRVATEPAFRSGLVSRAHARSHFFSWEKTAEATVQVYRGVLAGSQK